MRFEKCSIQILIDPTKSGKISIFIGNWFNDQNAYF